MKIKSIILFLTLLILLVGVASASDVSDDATTAGSVTEEAAVQQTQEVSSVDTQINEEKVTDIQKDTSSTNGATITKTIEKDTNSNIKKDTSVDSWSALGDAIDDATTDATITLSEGGVYEATRTITLNKQIVITIDGNGQTINGAGKRVFWIGSGSSLVLKNMTIKNANYLDGGAIYNKGNLTIKDALLTNNNATRYGGAIYNYLGNIIINDATLTNNTASNGGAIYNANGTINIIESTLQNNSANIGGAIYNSYNTVKIAKSSIENNHANNIGGAIYTTYNATLTVTKNVTLTNNTAENKGGAIYNDMSGTVNIDAAILANNSANLGGAIFALSGSLTINNSELNNNNATSDGGAIYNDRILNITNTTFENNYAKENGGAIFNNRSANLTITDSRLNYNQAHSGGAITNCNSGMLKLTNSNLTHNNASFEAGAIYNNNTCNLAMSDTLLEYNTADWDGGAIYNNGTVNITKSTLKYNNASYGGAIDNCCNMTIIDAVFNNNTAEGDAGAIENQGNLTINDTVFKYNNAKIYGGAVSNYANLNVNNLTFEYNNATDAGAIYNYDMMNISNSQLRYNNASNKGGAIRNKNGNLTITKSNLDYNTCEWNGGAIYNEEANLTITDTNMTYNQAESGGAIYDDSYEPNIRSMRTTKTATDSDNVLKSGDDNPSVNIITITRSKINNNNASWIGGAIRSSNTVNISDNTELNNNKAMRGGAIENMGFVSIANATLKNNTAEIYGGAIDNYLNWYYGSISTYDDMMVINDSIFEDNVANVSGGAIMNSHGTFTIGNSSFNNNSISGIIEDEMQELVEEEDIPVGGGAISIIKGESKIADSTFNDNSAGEEACGGAIYNYWSYLYINNTSLEKNSAMYGGAIENNNSYISMDNVTLNNNTATDIGGAIDNNMEDMLLISDDMPEDVIIVDELESYGSIKIINSNLINNEAYCGGAIGNCNANLIMTNTNITNNTASMGGAIINNAEQKKPKQQIIGLSKTIKTATLQSNRKNDFYSNIVIRNCTMDNNEAFYGGVILNTVLLLSEYEITEETGDCYSNVVIDESTIRYNHASYGGVIHNKENGTNVNITNSTIEFNTANNRGGAIYHEDGLLNINTTIFNNNTAKIGSAIHIMGKATIYNNTFKTNRASSGESAIVDEDGSAQIRDNINDKTSRYYSTIYTYAEDVSIIKNIFDDGVINTTITITTNKTEPTVGDNVRITFTLKGNDDSLLACQNITVTIDGRSYNRTTDDNGIATVDCTLKTNVTKVTAHFDGYYSYNETNASKDIFANKIGTKITLNVSDATPVNNTAISINATLTDAKGNKLAGQDVTLNINGKIVTNKTNAEGAITQSYTPTTLGTQTITAKYNGDSQYANTTGKINITVKKINTKLTVKVSNTTPVNSTPVNITVTLTDEDGNKLANQNITLSVGAKTFNVKTNTNGVATQSYTPTKVETQTITATYKGDSKYVNATATTNITVKKINSKLTVKASNTTPINNTSINITAVLTDESANKLAGQNVTLNVGNKTFNLKTDANGVAVQSYTPTKVEKQNITASYKGDSKYVNSTATTSITVKKINTKLIVKVSNTTPVLNTSINITVTLTDANGNKLSGQNVTLTVGGKAFNVKTNGEGVATQSYAPTKVETQKITAKYNGDSNYNNSTASTSITVKKIDTKLTVKVSNVTPVNNTQISITATLTDTNNNKLANQSVSINVDGKIYNVTTNKDGVATINYTPTKVQTQTITATFTGNSQDNNSTATSKITVRNKYNTSVVMSNATGIIGEKLTLKATVLDENSAKVNDGNVIFKINGVTIKDNGKLSGSGNPLKVKVVNGVATATIIPDVSMKSSKNIVASYVGTNIYNKSVSSPASIKISLRNASIEITLSKKIIKQAQVLTITAKVYDTTNGKKSTNLTSYPDEYVFFKVNGITLKNENNETIKVKLVNGVATINYTVPLGIAGIMDCKTMAIKNHTVIAGYYNKNYDTVSQVPTFQVERSNLTLEIANATANNKTHKLSLKVTVRDYLGNIVAGPNKFVIKVNGYSITNGTEAMYYYSVDGILTINNIDIPVYNKYNNIEVVTQDRLAYMSQRNITTKIKVLN